MFDAVLSSGFDLTGPVDWYNHAARVEPLHERARAQYHDAAYGIAQVVVARSTAVRVVRTAAAARRLPRRIMLLRVVEGSIAFRDLPGDQQLRTGDTVLYDMAAGAVFECEVGVTVVGLSVEADLVTAAPRGTFRPMLLPASRLLHATVAFVSSVVTDRSVESPAAESPRVADALANLQRWVVAEAHGTTIGGSGAIEAVR